MYMGPRPFGLRPMGPADNGQFAEDDFGSPGFQGLNGQPALQKNKKKNRKKKKANVDDAKFPTQKKRICNKSE